MAQGFDEPAHVAAGIEWLDKHTYTLDPVHPPVAEYVIALPLYAAGERLPSFAPGDPRAANPNDVGDAILYDHGRYQRNLFFARCGIVLFLVLGVVVLFLWTSQRFGNLAACLAVGLFTTLPEVLAFSSLAYNDLPVACMQFACLWVLALWLEKPTLPLSAGLGVTAGLACATKFSSLVFLPPCAAALFLCKWWGERSHLKMGMGALSAWIRRLALVSVIAVLAVWGTYGFSVGHVREAMHLSVETIPSFQHFPARLRNIARNAILSDPVIPAPELIHGLAVMWVDSKMGPGSYLFGKNTAGHWYFFFVAEAFKTPIPFLILALVGAVFAVRRARPERWADLAPVAAIAAVFFITMLTKYKSGTRYLMVILPLASMLAGYAGSLLWQFSGRKLLWARAALVGLLCWQLVATVRAQSDFIAYFNELAGRDPSRILLTSCDLDCGQDLLRLSRELKRRHISDVHIAMWSSADISQSGLPQYEVLQPFQPVTGWVAISVRSLILGHVFHQGYPPGAFAWLSAYRPVAYVGKTVRLYYIPPAGSGQRQ